MGWWAMLPYKTASYLTSFGYKLKKADGVGGRPHLNSRKGKAGASFRAMGSRSKGFWQSIEWINEYLSEIGFRNTCNLFQCEGLEMSGHDLHAVPLESIGVRAHIYQSNKFLKRFWEVEPKEWMSGINSYLTFCQPLDKKGNETYQGTALSTVVEHMLGMQKVPVSNPDIFRQCWEGSCGKP